MERSIFRRAANTWLFLTLLLVCVIGNVISIFTFWVVLPALELTQQARMESKVDQVLGHIEQLMKELKNGASGKVLTQGERNGAAKHKSEAQPLDDGAEYEFTPAQEEQIKGLKTMIHHTSLLFLTLGGLTLLRMLTMVADKDISKCLARSCRFPLDPSRLTLCLVAVDLSGEVGDGIDWCLFGMLLYQAKGSFKQIYSTEGSDITHLMNSITHLFVMFKKMRVLIFGIIAKNVGLRIVRSMGFANDDNKDKESPLPPMSPLTKVR